MTRRVLRAAALCLFCLALVSGRVVLSSRALWQEGQRALLAGDTTAAVRSLGRAARMYAPGNPYSERALTQLRAIGERAETSADRATARYAYSEVRSALLAARGLYTPHEDLLVLANQHLSVLMAAEEAAQGQTPAASQEELRAIHLRALSQLEAPRPVFVLLALLGAGLLIGAAIGLLRRGVDAGGRLVPAPAKRYGLLFLGGLALLVCGLWWA